MQGLLNVKNKNTKNVDVVVDGKIIDYFQDDNAKEEGITIKIHYIFIVCRDHNTSVVSCLYQLSNLLGRDFCQTFSFSSKGGK